MVLMQQWVMQMDPLMHVWIWTSWTVKRFYCRRQAVQVYMRQPLSGQLQSDWDLYWQERRDSGLRDALWDERTENDLNGYRICVLRQVYYVCFILIAVNIFFRIEQLLLFRPMSVPQWRWKKVNIRRCLSRHSTIMSIWPAVRKNWQIRFRWKRVRPMIRCMINYWVQAARMWWLISKFQKSMLYCRYTMERHHRSWVKGSDIWKARRFR